jgi:hypothetical protein
MNFTPSSDVAAILNELLDTLEQREPRRLSEGAGRRSIRRALNSLGLPAYFSQTDPTPRQIANEQLLDLERAGSLRLTWLPGETGHLLESVSLVPAQAPAIFKLLRREPVAGRRAHLAEQLLGDRFRFDGWRRAAVDATLDQLRAEKSPAPFSLVDADYNRDLLTALAALDGVTEETAYRVFSVRVFNDSKRFEDLMGAVATLARRSQMAWKGLAVEEVLRELNLVSNPGHLYLHGPWQLIDADGQILSLDEFSPSVGLPAAQAARLRKASAATPNVVCVENQTSFYELIRAARPAGQDAPAAGQRLSAVCLWGNPSPACRHLLSCLPETTTLLVWADLDYGGLNILAQLREQVNPRARPYLMDIETFDAHSRWARPLTPADVNNLGRLLHRPALADMRSVIKHLLARGLKLEQEAVDLRLAAP